jgi:2-keto-3-deoxy-6-phosphogluconate aldolase
VMLLFAFSMAAMISGIAGVSSPSAILRAIRSGYEACRQFTNFVQNGIERMMRSTCWPSLVPDNLF